MLLSFTCPFGLPACPGWDVDVMAGDAAAVIWRLPGEAKDKKSTGRGWWGEDVSGTRVP